MIVAVLAGYAFGRFRFRGSNLIFVAIIATMALPVYAVLIPLYVMVTGAGQIDTYQGIVFILVSANLPLAIWLLRSHIASLPPDIEGAALIDGASKFTLLWRIVVPLIAPGMAAVGVLVFLASWAAFLVPLTFAPTIRAEPLTVLITQYTSHYSVDFGLQAAAGMIALIPPILIVVWLNRYLLRGLLKGAGSH
ncbi:MAG: carbohydrate ABC transporter permease [Acidimicrobiales bacterium]